MSQTVQLTVPMPARLAKLRFPKALDDRLHHLLDEQGRKGRLTAAERKEAEGLAQMLKTVSSKSDQELNDFGARARDFVVNNKNYTIQGKRILEFIHTL